ncbi:hypothetical protein PCE1_000774 [Barthelona sp. PCE]
MIFFPQKTVLLLLLLAIVHSCTVATNGDAPIVGDGQIGCIRYDSANFFVNSEIIVNFSHLRTNSSIVVARFYDFDVNVNINSYSYSITQCNVGKSSYIRFLPSQTALCGSVDRFYVVFDGIDSVSFKWNSRDSSQMKIDYAIVPTTAIANYTVYHRTPIESPWGLKNFVSGAYIDEFVKDQISKEQETIWKILIVVFGAIIAISIVVALSIRCCCRDSCIKVAPGKYLGACCCCKERVLRLGREYDRRVTEASRDVEPNTSRTMYIPPVSTVPPAQPAGYPTYHPIQPKTTYMSV